MITFPREKRRIRLRGENTIYVVLCQGRDRKWDMADFWGKSYIGNYQEIFAMKKAIVEESARLPWWDKDDFIIAKVTLDK